MENLNTSSSTSWLSDLMLDEMEMEGCDLFQQNLFDDEDLFSDDIASVLQHHQQQQQPLSCESYVSYPLERSNKKLKTKNTLQDISNSHVSSHSSTTNSQILSFENTTTTHFHAFDCTLNTKHNNNNNNKGHIIAERKRREKLNKNLIALAALIPGLKKMDKASVLGDAIKYMKELQERLKVLEEQNKNSTIESVATENEPQLIYESVARDKKPRVIHDSWSDDGSESLSHVDARVLDKDVLMRILCQKQKGVLIKLLDEIQKLHLLVVNSSVLSFGGSTINITIVAKMETGYNLTRNDLVKNLRVAALKSLS
ncbi:unnamed protein product [Lathyrus oleraceus]